MLEKVRHVKSTRLEGRTSVWRAFKMGLFVFVLLLVAQLAIPQTSYAQGNVAEGLQTVGEAGGLAGSTTDLPAIIGRIINIVLGFVGIVLLVLMIYGGYVWMTSGGDATKIEQAKKILRNAIIGLVIVVSAFAITTFILDALISATTGGGGVSGGRFGATSGFPSRAGSLGGGIIETHIPFRDATNVPRNTPIIITFKEPIAIASFIRDYNDNGTPADLSDDPASSTTIGLNDDVIKIYRTGQRDQALTTAEARVSFTPDRRTFVIRPVELLGSPTENTGYTVELIGGGSGVLLEDGKEAFTGGYSDGYLWQFEVSTFVDNTPPHITSVIPRAGGSYAPNIIVQINFSEAMDPTSASGIMGGGSSFTNILVAQDAPPASGADYAVVTGEVKLSNQYRTAEFVADLSCGTNSCGKTVYCLPSNANITTFVHAATLSETPPLSAFSVSGYDGVTDVVGNSLDGNRNGTAEGPGVDDFVWSFGTLSEPNLEAPKINETIPQAGNPTLSSNQPVDSKPSARFDSLIQSSTANSDNAFIRTNEPTALLDTFWWSPEMTVLTADGAEAGLDDIPEFARISIRHRLYTPVDDAAGGTPEYDPTLESGIQNIYQNCFNPASSVATPSAPACTGSPHCCDNRSTSVLCPDPTPLP